MTSIDMFSISAVKTQIAELDSELEARKEIGETDSDDVKALLKKRQELQSYLQDLADDADFGHDGSSPERPPPPLSRPLEKPPQVNKSRPALC